MADTGEVQLHFLDYWRVVKNRWGIITLTFLLVVVTAYITTYFLPRRYTSEVTIEVKSNANRVGIFTQGDTMGAGVDPHFVADQLQILQSKGILYPVIDELGLVEKWSAGLPTPMSREDAYIQLQNMMRGVTDRRNTDMLIIPVTSTDPQEAADVANTIAVIYQKRRRDDQEQLISGGLAELSQEVEKQRHKVDLAEADMAKIRERDHIIDTNPDNTETSEGEAARNLMTEEGKLNEAKQRVDELKTQEEQIDKLTPDQLMRALAILNITDTNVSTILPEYDQAVAEDAKMRESGLGENYPRVKILHAQMAVWKMQLADAMDVIKKNLQTRLDIAQNYLDNENKTHASAQKGVEDYHHMSTDYIGAKQNYINEKRILDSAEQRYETERMQVNITLVPAEIWDRAERAKYPSSPNVTAYLVMAFLVGLGMGIGLAFFLEYLDTSVKTLADVEKFIGVSVLAVVPKIGGLLHKMEGGRSPDAETYRTLRTNIEFHKPSPDANTITIISGGPGEGKSTTLCNLAVTCANAGNNVLVVDADLRRPSQSKFFDLDGSVGLVNYVNGEKEFEDVIQQTPVENLWLIPSGPTTKDPVAILSSHRVVELIARAKTQFDIVLFDSPPILGLSDGAVLSSVVEMTVMVVQHRRFPRASLLRVKQAVLNVGGNLTGVVLNRVDTRDDQNYYYYTSYYDYYTPTPADNPRSKADI